jgi:hypothetical protein
MAYASRSGRARTSVKKPSAFFVCDRCGIWGNRCDGIWQTAWRGTSLQNIWLLVCKRCLDVPTEQLRAIQLPADPTPVFQPRVEQFAALEANTRALVPPQTDPITGLQYQSRQYRITQNLQTRVTQETGAPDGLDANAVMPYNGAVQRHYGVALAPLSIVSNGTATVTCTFSAAHGLCTGDQIAVEGVSNPLAAGFFTVTAVSAMAFTYMTYNDIEAAGLLTPTTRMITCLVGLPYDMLTIPQVGP